VSGAFACSATPPPEDGPEEPEWFALDTGKGCVQAKVACAPGNCAANIENQCKVPVTCSLKIECLCRTFTGEEGPATGKSEDTIPSGTNGGIATHVVCNSGDVLQTLARHVSCF
jgi:hypothetical protein